MARHSFNRVAFYVNWGRGGGTNVKLLEPGTVYISACRCHLWHQTVLLFIFIPFTTICFQQSF